MVLSYKDSQGQGAPSCLPHLLSQPCPSNGIQDGHPRTSPTPRLPAANGKQATGRTNHLALARRAEWRRRRCWAAGRRKHLCSRLPAHQDRPKHPGRGCSVHRKGSCPRRPRPPSVTGWALQGGSPLPLAYTKVHENIRKCSDPQLIFTFSNDLMKHWLSKFQ